MNSGSSRVSFHVKNLADLSSCAEQKCRLCCDPANGYLASRSLLACPSLVCFEPHLFCLLVRQYSGAIAVEICDHKKVWHCCHLENNLNMHDRPVCLSLVVLVRVLLHKSSSNFDIYSLLCLFIIIIVM